MAVRNGSSPKIRKVTLSLIFHFYSSILQLLIINQPSHTLEMFSNLGTHEIGRFISTYRVKIQKQSLNLVKNLKFSISSRVLVKTTGAIWFYNYSKTPDINQKSFKQLHIHCTGIAFFCWSLKSAISLGNSFILFQIARNLKSHGHNMTDQWTPKTVTNFTGRTVTFRSVFPSVLQTTPWALYKGKQNLTVNLGPINSDRF